MAIKISYRHESWPFREESISCIFNTNTYLDCTINDKSTLRKFDMLKDGIVIISLIYSINNNEAILGDRASFSFPEIRERTSFERVQNFLDTFYQHLIKEKVSMLRWLHFPEIYSPYYNSLLLQSLLNLGLVIENSSLNHHLLARNDFKMSLREDTFRRLKKIENSNLKVSCLDDFDCSFFYDQILEWRLRKGRPLNVEKSVLDKLIKKNKGKYLLFTVKDQNKLVAASLGLKIKDNILYYFIPSHDPEYDEYSPSIAIVKKMHEYIVENGIEYLDLGISSGKNEDENYGLIHFKEKLGSKTGIKYSLIKRLI